jgi:CheY-like chemotaxis protein
VSEGPALGNARILVFDDERLARTIYASMLNRLGYESIICQNGQEAVDQYGTLWRKIDMVILDVNMPIMSGIETLAALRKINPDVKTLFSSGYGLDEKGRLVDDQGAAGFLRKPFDLVELSNKVVEVLAQ